MQVSRFDLSVTINGRKVTEYVHNGDVYIEGRKGSEYELVFKNPTPYTKKIVISVDGINVVTGDRNWLRGYVVGPYNQISIPGFKRENGRAAAFTFSSIKDSYNQHNVSGEISNIGVIGCMVFDEIVPQPDYYTKGISRGILCSASGYDSNAPRSKGATSGGYVHTASAAAVPLNMATTGSVYYDPSAPMMGSVVAMGMVFNDATVTASASVAPSLGTEFGSDVEFKTRTVNKNFQQTADATLTLYYDDANGLQRRGIVLKKAEPAKPNPFPGFEYYCPDPTK